MYGPNADYRGCQSKAIQAVINNRLQVIAVLGTGDGKSLLYQLPARLPGAGTTILIVPLIALKQDTVAKSKRLGIECTVWTSEQPPSPGCPLVLVSIDQAVQKPFLTFANQLDAAGLLARVVLDESHLVCTAESYRRRMREVKQLRVLHCQFIFLTATLPPTMESAFEAALLLQHPLYIRSLTLRTDLEYHVVKVAASRGTSFELATAIMIQDVLQEDWYLEEGAKARALVFVRMKQQADIVAQKLGCPVYYSDSGTEEEKASVLMRWINGEVTTLVATSALAGVDYQHVRAVFHISEPSGGAIDFAQDVGRAGRDGCGGLSVVFLPTGWQAQYNTDEGRLLPESTKAMQRFLDAPRCRMIPLGVYLDGRVQSCEDNKTGCDRCHSLGLLTAAEREAEQKHRQEGDDVDLGSTLLSQHNRQMAQQQQLFTKRLDLLRGSCIICRIMEKQDAEHSLDQCRSPHKQRFFNAKRAAMQRGKSLRGGWLARYGACYSCGNTQAICQGQGQGVCKYKDILMPLCWSLLHQAEWKAKVLRGLPHGLEASKEEGKYMLWLGEETEIFGEQGTNLAVVADQALQQLL